MDINGDRIENSKHILVISQYFYPEAFRINDICIEWVKRGYKVSVITGIPNYPQGKFYKGYGIFKKREETWNDIKIYRIPLIPRGKSSIGLILNYISFMISGILAGKFKKIDADIVFSFEVSPMTQVLTGISFARKLKIPHYLYVQDLWPESITTATGIKSDLVIKPIDKMVDYIYKNVDKIFATSKSYVDTICERKKRVSRGKVFYWPQYAEEYYVPISKDEAYDIAIEKGIPEGGFKIIFTGNIGATQGLDILPLVARELKNEEVKFVMVGEGRYLNDFIKLVEQYNVNDKFIMIHRQPGTVIPSLLSACDVAFISFMDEKTVPAKIQSYLACGMPILAIAKGEIARLISDAKCGYCCNRDEISKIVEAIENIMSENNLEEFRKNSRRYYVDNFDKTKLLNIMDRYINE